MSSDAPDTPQRPTTAKSKPVGETAIKNLPENMRPREKMRSFGPQALTDAELLALFFGCGTVGLNVVDMSQQLLRRFGSLVEMARQPYSILQQQHGIGEVKALHMAAMFELGRRAAHDSFRQREITSSSQIYELLGPEMRTENVEVLKVVLVNTKLHLLRVEEVHRGTQDSVQAKIRDILRVVLASGTACFFLAHNHPSGDPTPSLADVTFTRNLRDACRILEVRCLDHVIIGQPGPTHPAGYYSFLDVGVLG